MAKSLASGLEYSGQRAHGTVGSIGAVAFDIVYQYKTVITLGTNFSIVGQGEVAVFNQFLADSKLKD